MPPPSAGRVAADRATRDRQIAGIMEDPAAVAAGRIAADRAARHGKMILGGDAAALATGRVAADRAVGVTVTVPPKLTMPPPVLAELPLIVLSVTVRLPELLTMPPPAPPAELPLIVLLVTSRLYWAKMPPPKLPLELPLIVLPVTVVVATVDAAAAAAGRVAADRAGNHQESSVRMCR